MKIRVHKLIILKGILATNLLILIAGMATLFLNKASFMLTHKIEEEHIPSFINYTQAQNRVKEMRFNELNHVIGNTKSAIRFEKSYQEYQQFVDKLAKLKLHTPDDFKKVDKIESVMEDYMQDTYIKNKGSFAYSPKAERLANEKAAELINKGNSLSRLLRELSSKEYNELRRKEKHKKSEKIDTSTLYHYREMIDDTRRLKLYVTDYIEGEMRDKRDFIKYSHSFLDNLKPLKKGSKNIAKIVTVEELYNQIIILSEEVFSYDPQIKKYMISTVSHRENWAEGSVLKKLEKTLDDSSIIERQKAEHSFYQLNEVLKKTALFVIILSVLALVTAIISIFMIKSMGDEDSKE